MRRVPEWHIHRVLELGLVLHSVLGRSICLCCLWRYFMHGLRRGSVQRCGRRGRCEHVCDVRGAVFDRCRVGRDRVCAVRQRAVGGVGVDRVHFVCGRHLCCIAGYESLKLDEVLET